MEDDLWTKEKLIEGENKHRVTEALKKLQGSSVKQWPKEKSRDSAVLVPMVTVNDEPSVLFTVRSRLVSRHRNQVR